MDLRKKFFLFFILVIIIPTIFMGLTLYTLMTHTLTSKYEDLVAENTNYIVSILEREFKQLENISHFFYSNEQVINRLTVNNGSKNDYNRVLYDNELTNVFVSFSTFDIFESFDLVCFFGFSGESFWFRSGSDFISRGGFKNEIIEGSKGKYGLYYDGIRNSIYSLRGNRKQLVYYRTIVDESYKQIGYMYIEMNPEYFGRVLNNSNSIPGASSVLVDNNNRVVYSDDISMIGNEYTEETSEAIKIERALRNGWRLISISPLINISKTYSSIFKIIILATLGTFLFSSLILWVITGRVVEPIHTLADAMDKVASGNELNMVYYNRNDEIGRLTSSFNHMTVRVKESYERDLSQAKKVKEADYRALQAQINPHFLYNTLNTLRWMAKIQKAYNIEEMLDALWSMLRQISKGNEIGTLGDEIELLKAYGKIQQIRYKGKFKLIFNVEQSHRAISCPKFIIQPFVENAIFHGIEPKKGTGVIEINSRIENSDLYIEIVDDGVGMLPEQVSSILNNNEISHTKEGLNNIGISNVHERLQLLFGEEYGITIESSINIGTRVMMKINFNETNH